MSTDRLEEIKQRAADPKIPWQRADFVWLMDEVERLRAERYVDSEVVVLRGEVDVLVTAAIAKDAEIERLREECVYLESDAATLALRAALQSLVDAIDAPWWTWADTNAARAVAAAVLTGGET